MKHTIKNLGVIMKYKLSEVQIKDTKGNAQIIGEVVTGAWLKYCMESRLFRILRYFGLR